jgi:hypothetical protein
MTQEWEKIQMTFTELTQRKQKYNDLLLPPFEFYIYFIFCVVSFYQASVMSIFVIVYNITNL